MATDDALLSILEQESTIRFLPGSTDKPDMTGIDLLKNPRMSSDGYAWYLADNKTEVPITIVGKLVYSGMVGDKTGPYFSIPGTDYVSVVRFIFLPLCRSPVVPGVRD